MEASTTDSGSSTITAWTLIVRARGSEPEASRALGELLEQFRRFIVWCMAALRPPPDTNPDDLFQEFALGFIRRREVEHLERNGSLRGWLKTSIRHFLYNEWDAYRRRQSQAHVTVERSASMTEAEIDAAFLASVVMQALELARARTPDRERFEKLVGFLPGPQSEVVPYATLKRSLGTSDAGARAAVHKERRRFQACFDEVVLRTLDLGDDANDPERVKSRLAEEKRALRAILDDPAEVVSLVTERKVE